MASLSEAIARRSPHHHSMFVKSRSLHRAGVHHLQPQRTSALSSTAPDPATSSSLPAEAEAAPQKPRKGRPKKAAANPPPPQQQQEQGNAATGAGFSAAGDASDFGAAAVVQSLVDALLGPAAAASLPPVHNAPAPINAFAEALAKLSVQCTNAGGTLLLLPSAVNPDDGSMVLDLALAESPGFGPDRSMWPARSTIRVGKKSSAPLLALVLATAVTNASAEAELQPIAALMEASGPVAVHIMLNAVCIARDKLQRQGLDCAVCLDLVTAPWMKPPAPDPDAQPPTSAPAPAPAPMDQVLRLHVLQRRLEVPVVEVSEFAALQLQQQQGQRQAQDVASQALADVVSELVERRAAVRLPAGGVGELALALKALALAANMASKARTGGYVAFVSTPQQPAGAAPGRREAAGPQRSLGELGEGKEQGAAQGMLPVVLEVRRLACPLRMSVMGPPEGRISMNSTAEGLHKALATKLSSSGYWSCQVDSPQLLPWLMELVNSADQALRHRGTRLGIMPELFTPRAPEPPPAAEDGRPARGRAGGPGLLMHFLEHDPLVDELLLPKPRRKELPVSGGNQLAVLNKVVALRNQRLGDRGHGLLLLRPFIDKHQVVRVALEIAHLPPASSTTGSGGRGTAEQQQAGAAEASAPDAPGSAQASAPAPAQPEGGDDESASELAVRFGLGGSGGSSLKTLLVSKTSDPGMVARAVGWELTKQDRRAAGRAALGRPLVLLRMGAGEALVHGVTAVAMVQDRLGELGLRALALPRQVLVEEEQRRFTVVEWLLYGEHTEDPAAVAAAALAGGAAVAAEAPAAEPSAEAAAANSDTSFVSST